MAAFYAITILLAAMGLVEMAFRWGLRRHLRKFGKTLFLAALLPAHSNATDYHVTTTATAGGTGSAGSPWRLIDALADNQNGSSPNHALAGGDNILLHGGTYVGNAGYVSAIRVNSGVVTIKPYQFDGRPKIDGNYNGAGGSDNTLTFLGTNVVLRDVEILNSWPTRYTVNGRPSGIVIGDNSGPAVNIQIINCWIHDVGVGIFYGINHTNCGDYGCIQWNIGYQNTPPDRGHGHAIYVQNGINSTSTHQEGSIWNTFDVGAQVFEQGGADVQNALLSGNIVVNSGLINDTGIRTVNYVAYSTTKPLKNLSLAYNFSWHNAGADTNSGIPDGFDIGNAAENSDVTITNNYSGNGLFAIKFSTNVTFLNNTSKTSTNITKAFYTVPGVGTNAWIWNNDTIINPGNLFDFNGFPQTFTSWQGVSGFDAGSSFTTTPPSSNDIFIRTNSYSTNRANIIVYNWHSDDTVNVDLTGVCAPATFFKVVAGSDPLGMPVYSGMYYAGMTVTLPMTNLSVAVPVGGFAVPTPNPGRSFMNFIVTPAWTNMAASAVLSDIQNAVNLSGPGDVVSVPAGTSTWATNLNTSAKPGLHFFGAGAASTVFVDEVPRTGNKWLLAFSGNNYQFGGFTLTNGVINTAINFDGAMKLSGNNFRGHDFNLTHLYAIGGVIKARAGLIDHGTFDMNQEETFQVYDADTLGYSSWATPLQNGTTNQFRFRDNFFANNNAFPALDMYGGSRVDIGFNTISNSSIGNHGTDSSQNIISARMADVHDNLFIFPSGVPNVPWPFAIYVRGGTLNVYSNKFQGRFSVEMRCDDYRQYLAGQVQGSPNWVPWGGITGSNVWDGNVNATALGYPSLHQPGRGLGDLLTGNPPINSAFGVAHWTRDALEPIYSWSNSLAIDAQPDGNNEVRTSAPQVADNRDYFRSTKNPTYVSTLVEPDPLITGTYSPPAQPPLPPSNLHIISTSPNAGQIIIGWTASGTGTVNDYRVHYGQTSGGPYTSNPDAGNVTSFTITGINPNQILYISVTAIDGSTSLESAPSNETSYQPASVVANSQSGNGNILYNTFNPTIW